jgi:DNA-binding PadR family transcriptional regulator
MILGCLMEFPTYGYKMLKSIYRDFYGHGPGVNDGQLYNTLKKMEREGFITRETVSQDRLPNKKLIFITGRGREQFLLWLGSAESEEAGSRYDFFNEYRFLNKCNFFNHLPASDVESKLREQLEEADKSLDSLLQARISMQRKKVSKHRVKILDYGIAMQRTRIKWLEEYRELWREEKCDEERA